MEDDPRWQPGMPALDRQASTAADRANGRPGTVLPPSLRDLPARSVPERAPTPLQRQFINLSAISLVCGAVAITALEAGVPLGSPLIKACVIVGAPLLALTTADAALRIWRSARAWMPVDRGKAWFRLSWLVVSFVLLGTLLAVSLIALRA